MSLDIQPRLSKLKGRENYDTWKIASKSYLVIKDLWSCIEKAPAEDNPKELEKKLKAWSELSLLIHENHYSYIANTETAKAAWKKLEISFEDSGLCRKVELLKQLVQMTLDSCDSVEGYVSKMVSTSLKVEKAGLKIDDELLASLMLAGLPNQFQSLVMAIENSTANLTSDAVKTFLLQEPRLGSHAHSHTSGAFSVRLQPGVFKYRCHNCGDMGHMAKYCEKTEAKSKEKNEVPHNANFVNNKFRTGL